MTLASQLFHNAIDLAKMIPHFLKYIFTGIGWLVLAFGPLLGTAIVAEVYVPNPLVTIGLVTLSIFWMVVVWGTMIERYGL